MTKPTIEELDNMIFELQMFSDGQSTMDTEAYKFLIKLRSEIQKPKTDNE